MLTGNDRVSTFAALLLAGLTIAVTHAQAPKDVLILAQNAMGSTLLGNMQFDATGVIEDADQPSPANSPRPTSKLTRYRLEIDYMIPAMRLDLERTNPARGRAIQSVRGNVAWDMGDLNGTNAAVTPTGDRLLQIWTSPHGVIKAAHNAGADLKVATERGPDGNSLTVLTFPAAGATVKATLNADNLVIRVETRSADPGLGPAVTESVFSGYKDAKQISPKPLHPEDLTGVMFPTRIVSRRDGRPYLDLTVTSARPNAYMVFPVPNQVKAATQAKAVVPAPR